MVATEDVSIAAHYTCAHPAWHLKVSTEFTDLERRIAYQSTERVHALGSSPCVLCRHTRKQCILNLSFQCQDLPAKGQSQYGALWTCAIFPSLGFYSSPLYMLTLFSGFYSRADGLTSCEPSATDLSLPLQSRLVGCVHNLLYLHPASCPLDAWKNALYFGMIIALLLWTLWVSHQWGNIKGVRDYHTY